MKNNKPIPFSLEREKGLFLKKKQIKEIGKSTLHPGNLSLKAR
jgi:hypothetical protein